MANATKAEKNSNVYQRTRYIPLKGGSAYTVYPGAMLGLRTDGYGAKFDDTQNLTFAGIICEEVSVVAADSDGANEVLVDIPESFKITLTSAAATMRGLKVYATFDNQVTVTRGSTTYGNLAGIVHDIPAGSNKALIAPVANTRSEPESAVTTLTDSTGLSGTHDDTLAATAALTTITDSSGYDGTHDDTVAAMAAIDTVTDSSGLDGTHDDTVAAVVNTDALTDNTGGAADDTLEVCITEAGGATITAGDAAKVHNNFKEIADQLATQRTLNGVLAQNQSDLAQKVIELVAREVVAAQNISDLSQKVIEVVAQLAVTNQNVSDVGQKVIEVVADLQDVAVMDMA